MISSTLENPKTLGFADIRYMYLPKFERGHPSESVIQEWDKCELAIFDIDATVSS